MNIEKRKIKILKKLKKLQGKKPKTFNQAMKLAAKHISLIIEYKKLDMKPRPKFPPGGILKETPARINHTPFGGKELFTGSGSKESKSYIFNPRHSGIQPSAESCGRDCNYPYCTIPGCDQDRKPSGHEMLTGINEDGSLKANEGLKQDVLLDAKAHDARTMRNAYQY